MKDIKSQIVMLLILLAVVPVVLSVNLVDLSVCDRGTERIADRVALCEGNDILETIESIQTLRDTNAQPYQNGDITFLYDENEGTKTVHAHLTYDLSQNQIVNLPVGDFAANMLEGNSVMLILEEEYYRLSYNRVGDLFSETNLVLEHIPTFSTNSDSAAFPGTNWHFFDVLAQQRIAVGTFEDRFLIRSFEPEESPAAYVIPWNLRERFEVSFTRATPVRITDPEILRTLLICRDDNSRDALQVKVCRDDELIFTLQVDKLTKREIAGVNYGFLFEIVNNVKQVSVFTLVNLDQNNENNKFSLNYNDFIDNMVEGRRIAFEFEDTLYLAKHPDADFLSLPGIELSAYTDDGVTQIVAGGSVGAIEFPTIAGGRIFIERNYGDPPPPFDTWALSRQELSPINLDEQLFTLFSSLSPSIFVVPNLGTVEVRENDLAFSAQLLKLQTDAGDLDLRFEEPLVFQDALFYYHRANLHGAIPVKQASIYKLYDLDTGDQMHPYDDTFIRVLTQSGKIALKFSGSYYVLSHRNVGDERIFFELENLVLESLDGEEEFFAQVGEGIASFEVVQGKIEVTPDDIASEIVFNGISQRDLATGAFAGYVSVLDTQNRVSITQSTLRMCFIDAYANFEAAKICDDNGRIEDTIIDGTQIITIDGNDYLFESNGDFGNAKRVMIRAIIDLEQRDFRLNDWLLFVEEITEQGSPLFSVGEDALYLVDAPTSRLEDLEFIEYPDGAGSNVENIEQITPISFNGSVVLADQVIFIEQTETGDEEVPLSAEFSLEEFSFIPREDTSLLFEGVRGDSFAFAIGIGGEEYILSLDVVGNELVRIRIDGILNRLFAEGDSRILYLEDVAFELTVEEITEDREVILSLTRI